MSSRSIENPETVEEIQQARGIGTPDGDADRTAGGDDEELPGEQASSKELADARETVADEHQPSRDHLPGTETLTVPFRGHEFEFDEDPTIMGELTAFHEDDNKSESELRQWAIKKLADLCMDSAADEDYWSQFAVSRNDGKDALVDVVLDVAGAPDEEERRKAEQFRNQR